MNILEQLWYGNVCPDTQSVGETKERKELRGYVSDHYDTLTATLTEKQKETFEKFIECYSELTSINEREIFVYGFRLGARIVVDVMSADIE